MYPSHAARIMPGKISRITTIVGLCIAGLLALLSVVIAVGQWRLVPVLSSSMRPGMDAGDLAITHPVKARDLKVGDVIVYTAPIDGNPTVIHRVVNVTESRGDTVFKTKGDANANDDTWTTRVTGNEKLLKREATVSMIGRPIHIAASLGWPAMMSIAFTFLAGLFVISFIWKPQSSQAEATTKRNANMAS